MRRYRVTAEGPKNLRTGTYETNAESDRQAAERAVKAWGGALPDNVRRQSVLGTTGGEFQYACGAEFIAKIIVEVL